VATDAGGAGDVVVARFRVVAIRALPRRHGVGASQGKSRSVVIERRIQPAVGGVAGLAGCRKSSGVTGGGRFEICRVAGIALGRHRLELAICHPLVTGIAIHGGMRSGEGKAVVMLLNLLYGDLPSADRVALLAIRSQLPLVNVGVAVLAPLSNIREHRLHVALDARHRPVHAQQRIFRLVVVKFRNSADRLPSARRVAVLTRHVQIAVRTVRTRRGLRRRASRKSGKRQQQRCDQIEYAPPHPHYLPLAPVTAQSRNGVDDFSRVEQFSVHLEYRFECHFQSYPGPSLTRRLVH